MSNIVPSSWNSGRVCGHMRRPHGAYYYRSASYPAYQRHRLPSTQCIIQNRTNRNAIYGGGNRQNDRRKSPRTGNNRIGEPNCLHEKERRLAPALRLLPQTKCHASPWLVSVFQNGCIYRFIKWHSHLFNLIYEIKILSSWSRATDRGKTAVKNHHGLSHFVRMPFRLKEDLATFQGEMNFIQSSMKWQSAPAYLSKNVLFSKYIQKHLAHLPRALKILQNAAVTLLLKKFTFFAETGNY